MTKAHWILGFCSTMTFLLRVWNTWNRKLCKDMSGYQGLSAHHSSSFLAAKGLIIMIMGNIGVSYTFSYTDFYMFHVYISGNWPLKRTF